MTFNAWYKIESGAEKKRKREQEVAYWNSLNGPVVIKSSKDESDGK
jgi:hypothetical protein